jgi:LacI family transcriptional regulator
VASIRDVARRAGVSTATVTRVLQQRGYVSDDARARVLTAVNDLDYVPNAVARSLTYGRSRLLGLLVPDITNPFFAELAQGVEDRVAESGYHALIATSHLDPDRERQFVAAFENRTLAAVAMTSSSGDSGHIERLVRSGMPVVFIDRRPRGLQAPLVRVDNRAAAAQAVRYLVGLGHRDIAMLTGPATFETASQRLSGFRAAMRAAGLPIRRGRVRAGHLEIDGGYEGMREVLRLSPRPTAVFSFNNLLTVGALAALREEGVPVPEALSLATFDDMTLFPYTDPPITALAQPAYQMGSAAAELMLDALENHAQVRQDRLFHAEFRVRGSCAAPQGASRPK